MEFSGATVTDLEQPFASVRWYNFQQLNWCSNAKVIVPVPVGVLKTTDPFHQNI
jgi:hypothetical protein